MNIWTFTGNLGKDAEVKVTSGGMAVMTFSVAVKSGFGDKEKTTWVNCGVFGKRAEGSLPQYLVKGAQVAISGEAFLDEWEKDGVTNKMLKVNVDKLDLIGGRSDNAPQQASRPQQTAPQPFAPRPTPQRPAPQQLAPQQGSSPAIDEWQDDIPF
jgi:single-strand DNA-binding protein